jgi:hypothetical protein
MTVLPPAGSNGEARGRIVAFPTTRWPFLPPTGNIGEGAVEMAPAQHAVSDSFAFTSIPWKFDEWRRL